MSLEELDPAVEIDVPPEITAAYDASAAGARFRRGSSAATAAPPVAVAAEATAPAARGGRPGARAPSGPEPEIEPLAPAGTSLVAGAHRVVVHTLDGEVLRGTLTDTDLEAPELELDDRRPGRPHRGRVGGREGHLLHAVARASSRRRRTGSGSGSPSATGGRWPGSRPTTRRAGSASS